MRESKTYHQRIHKGGPVIPALKQRQYKRHDSRPQQYHDKLIFKLGQHEFPQGRWRLFRESCLLDQHISPHKSYHASS